MARKFAHLEIPKQIEFYSKVVECNMSDPNHMRKIVTSLTKT